MWLNCRDKIIEVNLEENYSANFTHNGNEYSTPRI